MSFIGMLLKLAARCGIIADPDSDGATFDPPAEVYHVARLNGEPVAPLRLTRKGRASIGGRAISRAWGGALAIYDLDSHGWNEPPDPKPYRFGFTAPPDWVILMPQDPITDSPSLMFARVGEHMGKGFAHGVAHPGERSIVVPNASWWVIPIEPLAPWFDIEMFNGPRRDLPTRPE